MRLGLGAPAFPIAFSDVVCLRSPRVIRLFWVHVG